MVQQYNLTCVYFVADNKSWLLFYIVFMAGVYWQYWNRRYWWTRTSLSQTHLLHVDTFTEEWTLTTVWYRGGTCKWKWYTKGIDNFRLFSWRLKYCYVRMCETGTCIDTKTVVYTRWMPFTSTIRMENYNSITTCKIKERHEHWRNQKWGHDLQLQEKFENAKEVTRRTNRQTIQWT